MCVCVCVCVCVSLGGEQRKFLCMVVPVENRQRGRVSNKGYVRGAWRHFLHLLPCMLPNDNAARGIDTPRTAVCHPVPTTPMYPNVGGYVAWRPIPARSTPPFSSRPLCNAHALATINYTAPAMIIVPIRAERFSYREFSFPASRAGSYTVMENLSTVFFFFSSYLCVFFLLCSFVYHRIIK